MRVEGPFMRKPRSGRKCQRLSPSAKQRTWVTVRCRVKPPNGAKESRLAPALHERDARAYIYFDTAANNGECSNPWNCLSSALKCICRFELSELTVTLSSASFSTGVADIFL